MHKNKGNNLHKLPKLCVQVVSTLRKMLLTVNMKFQGGEIREGSRFQWLKKKYDIVQEYAEAA